MANLLQELLARQAAPPAGYIPPADEYEQPEINYETGLATVKKKSKFPEIKQAPQTPEWAAQAGLIAPGIGGLGNMAPTRAEAPLGPTDPNYGDPSAVPPIAANAERVPTPAARPKEADGSPTEAPAPATDVSSSNRGNGPQAAPPAAAPAAQGPGAQAPISPQAQQQMQQAPGGFSLGDIGSRIMNGLQNNSNTLLALGAGFAGAPNIGQGISRAAAAAIPARQADIKQSTLLGGQSSLFKALREAGVPPNQALAAIGNPDMAKALVKSYIEDRGQTIQMIKSKDPWGGETETPYVVNKFPKEGEPVLKPAFQAANGAPIPAPGAAGSRGQNPNGTAIYAPGIDQTTFDHSKVGDDYLSQFSPEMQQSVKDYLSGGTMPVGKSTANVVKQVAAKYGSDVGMPADDTSIVQRKEWARSIADTKAGVGLQAKGFQQGLEHFVKLSNALVKMNNSNGLGFEPAAGWINYVRGLSAEQRQIINKANLEGQSLAGEMGNLFSKNGGGVHERAATKEAISNSFMSSKAAAGALEGVVEMMDGGLSTLVQRRDQLFPNGNAPKGSEFMGPKQEAALAQIQKNIAILKGEETPDAASAKTAPKALPPGRYVYDPATGAVKPAAQ